MTLWTAESYSIVLPRIKEPSFSRIQSVSSDVSLSGFILWGRCTADACETTGYESPATSAF